MYRRDRDYTVYPEDSKIAPGLEWFGIREDFRRKKFGTTALEGIRRDGSSQRILVCPFVYGRCE